MISIIIVHYHVKKELFACIASIYASKPKSSFEIIVVDNDERKTIQKELKKTFPKVTYIKNKNKGFGEGNNVGARHAKGEYLFFLNPDTTFLNNVIDPLIAFLNRYKDAAIVAPLLFDREKKPYLLQGMKELTPKKAIFSYSFIQKLFPRNKIYQDYYLQNWDRYSIKDVDIVPGTAFVIRKKIFDAVKGFDEKFFLYFEEFDLCKRIRDRGEKIFITPMAKVFHAWGSSTKKAERNISTVFKQSRFYYMKKHFGFWKAFGTEIILRVNKFSLLLLLSLAIGVYLRFIHLEQSMAFIGDQGWYYLSARDMVLTGNIPLVGIPSSHPWISQGAYWTYLLAPVLWISQFNPISGAYLSVGLGIVSILGIYKLGSEMFSKYVGIIAAALFASSPLVIASDRMPYHTSPIPVVTIFTLYCIYQWIQGKVIYFPFVILLLAILYNLELATFLLSIFVGGILFYGFLAKKKWARNIFQKKILFMAFGLWFVAMFPMIIHDLSHGFPQTLKFLAWVGYRVLVFFGYPPINPITPVSLQEMIGFVAESYERLIFASNGFVALILFGISFLVLLSHILKKKNIGAFVLLGIVNFFLLAGLFVVKTPSAAYFPLLFPGLVLMVVLVFERLLLSKPFILKGIGLVSLLFVISMNSWFTIDATSANYHFSEKLEAAKQIVKESEEKEYTIVGAGPASEFESFTMNYEYLTWWLGHGEAETEQDLKFVIREENGEIIIKKEEN